MEKIGHLGKNGNLEKIVDLEFFKMSKNLEILKKFGKNLEILKILEIWKKQNWKFFFCTNSCISVRQTTNYKS